MLFEVARQQNVLLYEACIYCHFTTRIVQSEFGVFWKRAQNNLVVLSDSAGIYTHESSISLSLSPAP